MTELYQKKSKAASKCNEIQNYITLSDTDISHIMRKKNNFNSIRQRKNVRKITVFPFEIFSFTSQTNDDNDG